MFAGKPHLVKRVSGVGVMKVSDFSKTYPSKKPYLVVKFQPNNDRSIDYVPKKTFNDFNDAKKYAENFANTKGSNSLHDHPDCANRTCTEEDVNEFRHGTKDWHLYES